VIKIREEIDTITKQYKSGHGIDSNSETESSEPEEEVDWFNHYMKDY
jgi:hypothetical protein